MHLEPTGAWWLLGVCAALVVAFLLTAHSTKLKKNVPLFYCWLGAIAVLGGAAAFFLPIAVNSGFAKDDDGSALRQALLYTTGGLLGVITLGETHRKNNQEKEKNENDHTRQMYAERRSRYTKAVEQLASDKAAVRLGGIYTLVGLVDEWLADNTLKPKERQKEGQIIVNNLCSYIRSPFLLLEKLEEYKANIRLREFIAKGTENLSKEETRRYERLRKRFSNLSDSDSPIYEGTLSADQAKLGEEQNIRRTIFDEISKRSSRIIKDNNGNTALTAGSWSGFNFNFSRAPIFYSLGNLTIEKADFSFSTFYNDSYFIDTKFVQYVDFSSATFERPVFFRNTIFNGTANFNRANFEMALSFDNTVFEKEADFSDIRLPFLSFIHVIFKRDAKFSSMWVRGNGKFMHVTFTGDANFGDANFRDGTLFGNAIFKRNVNFSNATFMLKSPEFLYEHSGSIARAHFIISEDRSLATHNFMLHEFSQPIRIGEAELDGIKQLIPVGTVLFDPDSWDEEKQEYTRVSEPAKPLNISNDGEEDKSK